MKADLYFEDVDALKKEATFLNEIAPVLQGRSSTIAYMSWSGDASVTGTTQDFLSVEGYTMAKEVLLLKAMYQIFQMLQ